MGTLDWIIVGLFLLYSIGMGLRSQGQASQNLDEYFLAGRSLRGWQAGLSMAATQFASDTPLLVTGIVATAGVFALWQMWIYALAFLLMGFVLAPCWRRAHVLTDAEFTELRYGGRPAAALRIIKALYLGTAFNCTVLAWVFFAATRIAEPFLLWESWLPPGLFLPLQHAVEHVGVPLTLVSDLNSPDVWARSTSNLISIMVIVFVTWFYSTTGGLRAVVATDILQIGVMLGATLAYAITVVIRAGGLETIREKIFALYSHGGINGIAPEQLFAFTPDQAFDVSASLLMVFALQWVIQLNADGTGYLAQRSMACRSDHDARIASLVMSFTQILLRSLLWLPIALGLIVLFPPDFTQPLDTFKATREASYVWGMAMILPAGLKGLMLTGMLAALASTVDTHLNWGASYWTNDIYKRFLCEALFDKAPSPRSLVWVARGSNLLILLASIGIATQLTSIEQTWQISLLFGAGIGIISILRWIWWRMNAWGEIAALLSSLVLAPLLFFFVPSQFLRLLLVATGATLAAIGTTWLTPPEKSASLRLFYTRVKPPGFWGAVAQAAGDDPMRGKARLLRGLSATFCAALSLFCLLIGLGSWLIHSPAPVFFPWPSLWIALLLLVGIMLIPLWWRLGFDSKETGSLKA